MAVVAVVMMAVVTAMMVTVVTGTVVADVVRIDGAGLGGARRDGRSRDSRPRLRGDQATLPHQRHAGKGRGGGGPAKQREQTFGSDHLTPPALKC